MYACVYIYDFIYVREMNDNNATRDDKRDQENCYCKAFALPGKRYNVIGKWTWIYCKIQGNHQKMFLKSLFDVLKNEKKMGSCKMLS